MCMKLIDLKKNYSIVIYTYIKVMKQNNQKINKGVETWWLFIDGGTWIVKSPRNPLKCQYKARSVIGSRAKAEWINR